MEQENEPAANPAEAEPVNLDAVEDQGTTEDAQTEAQSPAGGEGTDFSDIVKEAMGETPATSKIEVEMDGKTYTISVPEGETIDPDFKPGMLRDWDYRKKTMSHSDDVKAFEQEQQFHRGLANLEGDGALLAKRYREIDAEFRELASLNVSDLQNQGYTDEQIEAARQHVAKLAQDRQTIEAQLQRNIETVQNARTGWARQAKQEAVRKAGLMDKAITPERVEQLEKFAMEIGFSEADIQSITTPHELQILHFADIGRKLIERQTKVANLSAAAAGTPAKTVGGVKSGNKRPEDMTVEEYAAWRSAGNG